jgi:membrane-bound ClpP family serine protease
MSIGTGVVLFVIGAILAFATNFTVSGFSLHTAGYILMAAGAVVFFTGLALTLRSRKTVAATNVDPATGSRVTRTTSNDNDPLI